MNRTVRTQNFVTPEMRPDIPRNFYRRHAYYNPPPSAHAVRLLRSLHKFILAAAASSLRYNGNNCATLLLETAFMPAPHLRTLSHYL